MSGVITAVVATVTEVVTAVATAVTTAAEAVAGAVVSGAQGLGLVGAVGECTATEAALTGYVSGVVSVKMLKMVSGQYMELEWVLIWHY